MTRMDSLIDALEFVEITEAVGIYCIYSAKSNAWYVGQSSNMRKRKREHLSLLAIGTHANKRLQNTYNKHGADDLMFRGLEYCDRECVIEREQSWFDYLKFTLGCDMMNFGDFVIGGGNTTNHPSRLGIPLKDGRTERLDMRLSPDALTKLKAITASRKQSRSDYLQEKIEEDYKNIQKGENEMNNEKVTLGNDPESACHWEGPGWYGLQKDERGGFVKVSINREFKTLSEAIRTDFIGTPILLESLEMANDWINT